MPLRLFVALDPPDSTRAALASLQDELRRSAGPHSREVKWVPAENLHLTLQFLGAVADEALPAVAAAVAAAAAASRPLDLSIQGAGAFPSPRRPRVLWAGLAGALEAAAALVRDLGARLAPLGFPPEARPWSAHLTLGRARDPRGSPRLAPALLGLAAPPPAPWRSAEVTLFRSHLSPRGPRYEPLARAPLGASPGP